MAPGYERDTQRDSSDFQNAKSLQKPLLKNADSQAGCVIVLKKFSSILLAIVLTLLVISTSGCLGGDDNGETSPDQDKDGIPDTEDAFPNDPAASVDKDGDGYPDLWNSGKSEADSTSGLTLDTFPDDKLEWLDTDNDGIGDNQDDDDDGDGYNDTLELSEGSDPLDPESIPADYDKDLIPDSVDSDDDDDGVNDELDAFPFDENEWVDTDEDGTGNNADLDDDDDGYDDLNDTFPLDNSEWNDTDSDGTGDNADLDDDNDGLSDILELGYGSNPRDSSDVTNKSGIMMIDDANNNSGWLLVNEDDELGDTIEVTTQSDEIGNGTFTVVTSQAGENYIHSSDYEMSSTLTDSIYTNAFQNIEVEVNSVSYFMDGYTFGIGITETEEFAFVYDGVAPTFFNNVTLIGTVIPSSVFFKSSIFEFELFGQDMNLQQLLDMFDIEYDGDNLTFLYVSEIIYQTQTIIGDIYAHTVVGDLEMADSIHNSGMEYLSGLSESLNETTIFLLGEGNNTISDFSIWGILVPYGGPFDFDGIVSVEVAETDLQPCLNRLNLNLSTDNEDLPIKLKIGVCRDETQISTKNYQHKSVSDLWAMTDDEKTMIDNVIVSANSIILDLESASEKLDEYFKSGGDLGIIDKITSYANPAIALLFDLDASEANRNDKDELMKQIGFALIPDFQEYNDGFSTYEFTGILYQMGTFLNVDKNIPLIIVESYRKTPAPHIVDLNAVTVVIDNYTVGYGSVGEEKYILVTNKSMPAFFSNISVEGIIIPTNLLWLFVPEFSNYTTKKDEMFSNWNIDSLPDISLMLVKSFTYKDVIKVRGDPYTVLSLESEEEPKDTFESGGLDYVNNVLAEYLNAQIIILGSENTTLGNLTFWFLYTTKDISAEEIAGLPTLNVSEMDYSIFNGILGHDFVTETLDELGISIRIGTIFENSPYILDGYDNGTISDIWDIVLGAETTAVDSIRTESFAFVASLEDVLENLNSMFGSGGNTENIESITSFANPAFAFMIDRNILDIFSVDNLTLTDMLAIAFIPDYDDDKYGNFNYFQFEGVVYNMTNFFGLENTRGIPLYVIDNYEQIAPPQSGNGSRSSGGPANYTPLANITENAGSEITWFKTRGFISGTTGKTVAEYVQLIPEPTTRAICKGILAAPIDIGIYLMSMNVNDSATYTVPVLVPTVSKGDTFFGNYVELDGFYFNLSESIDKIKNIINITDSVTGISDIFGKIFGSLISTVTDFFGDDTNLTILEGFFIGSTIFELPNPNPAYEIEDVSFQTLLHDSEKNLFFDVNVTASKRCKATLIIETPNGTYHSVEQNTYIDTKFSLELTIPNPVEGLYNISIYLVSFFDITKEVQDLEYRNIVISFPPSGTTDFDTGDDTSTARVIEEFEFQWEEMLGEKRIIDGVGNRDIDDYYSIELNEGDNITIYLKMIGDAEHDLYLYLNSTDNEIATSKNSGTVSENINYFINIPGWYYIDVYDTITGNSGKYNLSVSVLPEPNIWFENITTDILDLDENGAYETFRINYELHANTTNEFTSQVMLNNSYELPVNQYVNLTNGVYSGYIDCSAIVTNQFNISLSVYYHNILKDNVTFNNVYLQVFPFFWIENVTHTLYDIDNNGTKETIQFNFTIKTDSDKFTYSNLTCNISTLIDGIIAFNQTTILFENETTKIIHQFSAPYNDSFTFYYTIENDNQELIHNNIFVLENETLQLTPGIWFSSITSYAEDNNDDGKNETGVFSITILSDISANIDIFIELYIYDITLDYFNNSIIESTIVDSQDELSFNFSVNQTDEYWIELFLNDSLQQHDYSIKTIILEVPDVWLNITLYDYDVESGADVGTQADVYFEVIAGNLDANISERINNENTGNFSDSGILLINIPDNIEEIIIIIKLYDYDAGSADDPIDIDGSDNGDDEDGFTLRVIYNLTTDSWSGDDNGNSNEFETTDGNDDGSFGDLDGALDYIIRDFIK